MQFGPDDFYYETGNYLSYGCVSDTCYYPEDFKDIFGGAVIWDLTKSNRDEYNYFEMRPMNMGEKVGRIADFVELKSDNMLDYAQVNPNSIYAVQNVIGALAGYILEDTIRDLELGLNTDIPIYDKKGLLIEVIPADRFLDVGVLFVKKGDKIIKLGAKHGDEVSSALSVTSKLVNGSTKSTKEILDLSEDFLGPNYRELIPGSGRFVSADGTRVVRMGVSDITGKHGGGPHVNFETLVPNPLKPGKMTVSENIHIYIKN